MKSEVIDQLFCEWCDEERKGEIMNWWDVYIATEFVRWGLQKGHLSVGPELPSSVKEVT